MTHEEKVLKLKQMKQEVSNLESELNQFTNYIPLKIINKGKFTIQIHPKHQVPNLIANGWASVCETDLKELSYYLNNPK